MTNPFEILEERLIRIECQLFELQRLMQQPQFSTESDELLNVQQASKLLGLAVQTIYGYVSRREIPVCKRGKRLYFSEKELLEWVRVGRQKTFKEIEAEAMESIRKK